MNAPEIEPNYKDHRLSWDVGSGCSIYVKSSKRKGWFPGEIVSVIADDRNKMADLLVIRFGFHYGSGRGKKLPRDSLCLKPLMKYKTLSFDSPIDIHNDIQTQNVTFNFCRLNIIETSICI